MELLCGCTQGDPFKENRKCLEKVGSSINHGTLSRSQLPSSSLAVDGVCGLQEEKTTLISPLSRATDGSGTMCLCTCHSAICDLTTALITNK